MFKFLRKYNKLMLAVFGVLLMITFLIPQAFDGSGGTGASGATLGYIGKEKYSAGEHAGAATELEFIERLGASVPGVDEVRDPTHWYLLVREAENAGLVSTAGSVPIDEENLNNIVRNTGHSRDFVRQTIAKLNGVAQLIALHRTGGLYSDRRLTRSAERLLHQASVQLVVLEASGNAATSFEPTPQQVEEHYNKYRDLDPGESEYGFGYKLPDRVKLEWIEIPIDSIREAVRKSADFNSVAQRLHWRRNVSDPAKSFPPVQDTGAVPDVVSNDLLEKLTRQKADEIARFADEKLRLNRRSLPEQDGYVVVPSDWKKLEFQELAGEIQSRFGVALPNYQSTGDRWIPLTELTSIEKVGNASTDKLGPNPIRLAELVKNAKEFNDGPSIGVPIQRDIAGPPLKASDGSVFMFRIIDADAARAPASIDEVRDQVATDLRRLNQYQQLLESADELERAAEERGLLSLALEHDKSVERGQAYLADQFSAMAQQRMQFNLPMMVDPASLPVIGRNREVNERIIDHALATLPKGQPLDAVSESDRVITIPVPEKLAVAIVRIVHQYPLTQERFADLTQRNAIQQMIAIEESKDPADLQDVFGFDSLKKRHNFTSANGEGEEPPADSAASAK